MAETQAKRLDRIEEKIDKLADAMVSLARTEEKIMSMEKENHNHFERMNRFSEKLDNVERKVNENAHTVKVLVQICSVVGVAIIGAIVNYFWM
ncbi:MAG: hypothetical protein VW862_07675 [Euryarchaeota archaeon]